MRREVKRGDGGASDDRPLRKPSDYLARVFEENDQVRAGEDAFERRIAELQAQRRPCLIGQENVRAMAKSALELQAMLAGVPRDRVIGHLVVSLIGRRVENVRACGSLLSLFAVLAAHLEIGAAERLLLADELRDLADEVEHARERVEV